MKSNIKLRLADAIRPQGASVIDQMRDAGFEVTHIGDDHFVIKSLATGGIVRRDATMRDLTEYVTCINYVAKRHGKDIYHSYNYTKPAHG